MREKGGTALEQRLPALPVMEPPGTPCPLWELLSEAQAPEGRQLPMEPRPMDPHQSRHSPGHLGTGLTLARCQLPGIPDTRNPPTARYVWVCVGMRGCAWVCRHNVHFLMGAAVKRESERRRPNAASGKAHPATGSQRAGDRQVCRRLTCTPLWKRQELDTSTQKTAECRGLWGTPRGLGAHTGGGAGRGRGKVLAASCLAVHTRPRGSGIRPEKTL